MSEGARTCLRCRVSPDVEHLRMLHEQHWWLPSPEQIRPSAEVRAIKEATIERIMGQYQSPVDFVLSSVFDAPATRGKDGKLAVNRAPTTGGATEEWSQESIQKVFTAYKIKPYKFAPNNFPYNLDEGARHFVMWYNTPKLLKSDDEVTRDIFRELRRHLMESQGVTDVATADASLPPFDFAWYVNPKMTIPFIAHVQVFWVADPANPAYPAIPATPAIPAGAKAGIPHAIASHSSDPPLVTVSARPGPPSPRASEHIDPALPSLQACLEALGVSLCLCLYIYCYSAIAHQNIYTKSLLLPYTKYMYTIHPVRQLTLCSWNFFSRPPRAGLASKPI
eukprot:Tamp_17827.p1 GENE.Tamp_17827~~Tamp_17827.p1  ORF type:complete len:336 (-),score=26.30 Tamp_17827:314-1321(-)